VFRTFPRDTLHATNRRKLQAALVVSCALVCAGLPAAAADDLEARKHKVQGDIRQAERHLDQSADRLVVAVDAVQVARADLDVARAELATTQGKLAAAEVMDRQMQAKLDTSIAHLVDAREELAAGRADLAVQEDVLGQLAVQNYQGGDPALLGLSMVLTSQQPAELSSQLNSVRSVLDKEAMTLERLDASRVVLGVKEAQYEQARREVAAQRRAAAANLRRKSALEAEAAAEEQSVSDLVARRASARKTAARAKAEDRKQLRGLERERVAIETLLRKRAEAARRRAAARAAARAEESAARPVEVVQQSPGLLSYPVDSSITSGYGVRLHPIYRRFALHDGTDFGAACGTPVRAAYAGTVVGQYYNTGYGNRVILDSGFAAGAGLATSYNHLSGYATEVGQRVDRGEVVGYVGNTGYSTGCHLHFMVFRDGTTVDPLNWL